MSNDIFPTLRGVAAERDCTPEFDNVVARADSGRRYAMGKRFYPVWSWNLRVNFLRQRQGHTELTDLQGFFLRRRGNLDSFLYRDREWHTVASPQVFGLGDGVEREFRLVYDRAGFIDRVGHALLPQVFADGAPAGTNLLDNSSFEVDANANGLADGWSVATGGSAVTPVFTLQPASPLDGTRVQRVEASSLTAGDYLGVVQSRQVAALQGKAAYLSASFRCPSSAGPHSFRLYVAYYDSVGAYISAESVNVPASTSWTLVGLPLSVPVTAVTANVLLIVMATSTAGLAVDIDKAQLVPGTARTGFTASNMRWTHGPNATITFDAPPAAGMSLSWTGDYLYRVAFKKPSMTFTQFLKDLYSTGVELETVNL